MSIHKFVTCKKELTCVKILDCIFFGDSVLFGCVVGLLWSNTGRGILENELSKWSLVLASHSVNTLNSSNSPEVSLLLQAVAVEAGEQGDIPSDCWKQIKISQ